MLTFSCAITEKVTKKRVSKKVIFFMDGGLLLLSMNKGTEKDLGCDNFFFVKIIAQLFLCFRHPSLIQHTS